MDEIGAVSSLAALAQESRLAVFRLLVQQGASGLPAGEISRLTAIPPTTLSFHLSQLSRAGLIGARRAGRQLIYAADFAAMQALLGYLVENCCQGACAPTTRVTLARRPTGAPKARTGKEKEDAGR
jgi:DNA-binding transcriptional ArsR family regulator